MARRGRRHPASIRGAQQLSSTHRPTVAIGLRCAHHDLPPNPCTTARPRHVHVEILRMLVPVLHTLRDVPAITRVEFEPLACIGAIDERCHRSLGRSRTRRRRAYATPPASQHTGSNPHGEVAGAGEQADGNPGSDCPVPGAIGGPPLARPGSSPAPPAERRGRSRAVDASLPRATSESSGCDLA